MMIWNNPLLTDLMPNIYDHCIYDCSITISCKQVFLVKMIEREHLIIKIYSGIKIVGT